MPNLASRNQAGQRYCFSDCHVPRNNGALPFKTPGAAAISSSALLLVTSGLRGLRTSSHFTMRRSKFAILWGRLTAKLTTRAKRASPAHGGTRALSLRLLGPHSGTADLKTQAATSA